MRINENRQSDTGLASTLYLAVAVTGFVGIVLLNVPYMRGNRTGYEPHAQHHACKTCREVPYMRGNRTGYEPAPMIQRQERP